ncbi:hypothetical protein ATZ36_11315 [Candidatus Endomicrobiellum trichonymphae]|uniref:Uncharacterized protein n=1 Tax=Endomicrobium trichonymphae TaxID=1408204 RepID=A0A1E5IFH2_ENDTX|nr:hypothetical protein ATZ36_11315 [Candidatus Endomicrobium trichonymphae]
MGTLNKGISVVVDAVGVGATKYRNEKIKDYFFAIIMDLVCFEIAAESADKTSEVPERLKQNCLTK